MASLDVRWKQRLSNFQRALHQLRSAVSIAQSRSLSDLEKQGLIQAFEFTHELAWNVMKDYFEYQGNTSITGSRDAARLAFQMGLVQNGQIWMEMVNSRNQTSHTYNENVSSEIIHKVLTEYFPEFQAFSQNMVDLSKQ